MRLLYPHESCWKYRYRVNFDRTAPVLMKEHL